MSAIILPAARMSGHITMRRWREGVEPEVREFTNLITDAILESRIADNATIVSIREALAYCRVGTDGTAPLPTDTALGTQLAASNVVVAGPDIFGALEPNDRGFVSLVTTYRFSPGAATGSLEEVGFGSTAAAAILMSRALILDEPGGNPTPLVVGAADYLDVTYELRLYSPFDNDDWVDTGINIDGDNYDIRIRAIGAPQLSALLTANPGLNWTSFNTKEIRQLNLLGLGDNWIGAFDDTFAMPQTEEPWELGVLMPAADANTVLAAYVPGSKERSISVTIPAGDFNFATGIRYLRLSTSEGSWGMEFDPPLTKVVGKVVTFTVLVQAIQRFNP